MLRYWEGSANREPSKTNKVWEVVIGVAIGLEPAKPTRVSKSWIYLVWERWREDPCQHTSTPKK